MRPTNTLRVTELGGSSLLAFRTVASLLPLSLCHFYLCPFFKSLEVLFLPIKTPPSVFSRVLNSDKLTSAVQTDGNDFTWRGLMRDWVGFALRLATFKAAPSQNGPELGDGVI